MTVFEAAQELGLTPATLRVQIKEGKLHSTKHGRDHWLTQRDIDAYRRDHLGKMGRPVGAKDGQPRKRSAPAAVEPAA